ncbi:hypothetical protein ACP70R_023053 [Stipagrostis hirtigluma subsp. patula]
MTKNKCKFCSRRFATHGALAAHMRSHSIAGASAGMAAAGAANLKISSTSSASAFFAAATEDGDFNKPGYINADYPNRSHLDADAVLSHSDIEAEYTPARAKRASHAATTWSDAEPLSSMSHSGTHAEDVAWSLLKLSRDTWASVTRGEGYYWEDGSDAGHAPPAPIPPAPAPVEKRTQFQCVGCKKVFRSYQALGGHRASTARGGRGSCCGSSTEQAPRTAAEEVPVVHPYPTPRQLPLHDGDARVGDKLLLHSCPYCHRVFCCGQALGGQQHPLLCPAPAAETQATSSSPAPVTCPTRTPCMIDLNVAPPFDEVELFAVSDPRLNPGC